ncbi:MAG: ATP phosphoribosyltransferase [Acidimicrobiia bacterium]|nr:ATP phosphoribosyltransferase [bacterium]MXZ07482.1 ATP phosphoribosyltransferase [Acidimicrobiia bacterium]MYH56100.1 ATP phosphoribosyltransferase [Acidimicrobiia bacterium]
MAEPLRIAIPNKGRLREPTISLLREAGLSFEQTERSLTIQVRNAEIALLFVRAEDVVELVENGVADLGITGLDLLEELRRGNGRDHVTDLLPLGYGRCDLTIAVPVDSPIQDEQDFGNNMALATSHPNLARRYFQQLGAEVQVKRLRGSVEVAPKLGFSGAVADLVSTGSTMLINGLRPVATIMKSEAVLIGGIGFRSADNDPRRPEIERVITAIESVLAGRTKRYLLLNAPDENTDRIIDLIPGLESPTVIPLAEVGMVSIHSVVGRDEVWNLLPRLREAGGRDILVLPIGQLIP